MELIFISFVFLCSIVLFEKRYVLSNFICRYTIAERFFIHSVPYIRLTTNHTISTIFTFVVNLLYVHEKGTHSAFKKRHNKKEKRISFVVSIICCWKMAFCVICKMIYSLKYIELIFQTWTDKSLNSNPLRLAFSFSSLDTLYALS